MIVDYLRGRERPFERDCSMPMSLSLVRDFVDTVSLRKKIYML